MEVSITMDHKPLVTIFKKDVVTLSSRSSASSSGHINTGSEYYTSQGRKFSLQIGCPVRITRKTKMKHILVIQK